MLPALLPADDSHLAALLILKMRNRKSIWVSLVVAAILALGLYLCSLYNYLLFHSLAEIFAIVIGVSIFLVAWNTGKYVQDPYLPFIGVAYLAVAALDLLHTFTYSGMTLLPPYYDATQLWIAARYMESLSFLTGCIFFTGRFKMNMAHVAAGYVAAVCLVCAAIFIWRIFPECYVHGQGPTVFKILSEYAIIAILGAALFLLRLNKDRFDKRVYFFLAGSVALTMISEFFFTLYIGVYDAPNMIGHYIKILSFYFVYKAIIETGLTQPIGFFFGELKQSEEALKNLNATKDKIFSILAHDLKSPFNTLIGFSQLLLNNQGGYSKEEELKLIQMINISCKKASGLLENLMQWSLMQTGSLCGIPETFDLSQLIDSSVDLLSGSAKEKNIAIEKETVGEMAAYADKNMIETALRNLINNAIKFTLNGGLVRISAREKPDCLEVSVSDTGVGIPEDALAGLFSVDKGREAEGAAQERGGGIGLIICREFVEKNGGTIRARSKAGEGAEFIFTVPKGDPRNLSQPAPNAVVYLESQHEQS